MKTILTILCVLFLCAVVHAQRNDFVRGTNPFSTRPRLAQPTDTVYASVSPYRNSVAFQFNCRNVDFTGSFSLSLYGSVDGNSFDHISDAITDEIFPPMLIPVALSICAPPGNPYTTYMLIISSITFVHFSTMSYVALVLIR